MGKYTRAVVTEREKALEADPDTNGVVSEWGSRTSIMVHGQGI